MKDIAKGSSSTWKAALCVLVGALIGACALALTPIQKAEAFESECIYIGSPKAQNYAVGTKVHPYYLVMDAYDDENIQSFVVLELYRGNKLIHSDNGGFVEKGSYSSIYPGVSDFSTIWKVPAGNIDAMKRYLSNTTTEYPNDPAYTDLDKAGTYTFKVIAKPYNMKTNKLDTSIPKSKYRTKTVMFTMGGLGNGKTFSTSVGTFKVTKGAEAQFIAANSKKAKSVTIPATIASKGVTYKVTSIAASAFKGNSKLKTIIVKSASIKSIGKDALKGISKKATIKVPKANYKKMKKLLTAKSGFKKTMKIQKS